MRKWIGYLAVGLGVLLAAYTLMWEAEVPLTAVRFIATASQLSPHIIHVLSPFAVGFLLTASAAVLGVASFRRSEPMATLAWFLVADVTAPIFVLGGYAVVTGLARGLSA